MRIHIHTCIYIYIYIYIYTWQFVRVIAAKASLNTSQISITSVIDSSALARRFAGILHEQTLQRVARQDSVPPGVDGRDGAASWAASFRKEDGKSRALLGDGATVNASSRRLRQQASRRSIDVTLRAYTATSDLAYAVQSALAIFLKR